MSIHQIAFWNVENLFDVQDSTRRSPKLQRVLRSELASWTQDLLDTKIGQLAAIIRRINDVRGLICSACAKSRTRTSSGCYAMRWHNSGVITSSLMPTPRTGVGSMLPSSMTVPGMRSWKPSPTSSCAARRPAISSRSTCSPDPRGGY